jgi:hypothetical protein
VYEIAGMGLCTEFGCFGGELLSFLLVVSLLSGVGIFRFIVRINDLSFWCISLTYPTPYVIALYKNSSVVRE